MKSILAVSLVLCLAVVANAQYITPSYTFLSTQIVKYSGTTTTVDVYKVTLTADDPNGVVGAILICAGDSSDPAWSVFDAGMGANPFQVWRDYGDGDIWATPTWEDANRYTRSYLASDSHLLAGIGAYSPQVLDPTEENDGLIYTPDPDTGGYVLGQGVLALQAAVPSVNWARSIDVAQIGVIRGTQVYLRDMSFDGVNENDITVLVPEPATLALLGLGVLALIRRRN
jgi:hypothetical protein